jgi:hypothetical protein
MRTINKHIVSALSTALIGFAAVGISTSALAADKLFFEGDMVRGVPKGGPTGPVCVLTSQFKRGESVVWRVRVFDPAKSKQLGKAGIKSLVVVLPDGNERKMHYGTHPRKNVTDSFWSVSWQVPADYPTGSFSYKVVATDSDGRIHTWQPFNIKSSQLTVIAGNARR